MTDQPRDVDAWAAAALAFWLARMHEAVRQEYIRLAMELRR